MKTCGAEVPALNFEGYEIYPALELPYCHGSEESLPVSKSMYSVILVGSSKDSIIYFTRESFHAMIQVGTI